MSQQGRTARPPDRPPSPTADPPQPDAWLARERERLLGRMALALALGLGAEQVLTRLGHPWPPDLGLSAGTGPLLLLTLTAVVFVGARAGALLLAGGVLGAVLWPWPWVWDGPLDLAGPLVPRVMEALPLAYCGAAALALARWSGALKARVLALNDECARLRGALADLEQQLAVGRMLLERAPLGLAVLAPGGRYALVNRRLCNLLAVAAEDLIGRPREHLPLVAGGAACPWGRFDRALARLGTHTQDLQIRRADATLRRCQVCLSLMDPRQPHGWAVLALVDLGRRTGAQRALAAAHRGALAQGRQQDRLLGTLSHDLRSPLQSILGYCDELARRGACAGPDLELLAAIRRNGSRLLALAQRLLDLNRLQAGGATAAPCDLCALLAGLAGDLGPRARDKGLELRLEVAAGVPAALMLDTGALLQILTNLLDNAIRLTRRGAVVLRAGATASGGAGGWPIAVWIEVEDSGPGIPRRDRRRIFAPYRRLDDRGPGAGLGLTICRAAATALGGDLRVQSRPGAGSRFRLSLPRVAVASGAPAPAERAVADPGLPQPQRRPGATPRPPGVAPGLSPPAPGPDPRRTPADLIGPLGREPLPPTLALDLHRLLAGQRPADLARDPAAAGSLAAALGDLGRSAGWAPLEAFLKDWAARLSALGADPAPQARRVLWEELGQWALDPPPPAALAALRGLADLGLITGIEDWCLAWCGGDGRHRGFAREVLGLAYRFDPAALLAFVDAFLPAPGVALRTNG